MTDTQRLWVIVALAVVAIVLIVAIAVSRQRARRRQIELRQRFGPEYDRAVQEFGSTARADRELLARAKRVQHLELRALSLADHQRFSASWSRIQAQFVDDPGVAVAGAGELINEVMRARGYPTEDFEQRAADLSVEHADVVQHYRAAKSLYDAHQRGQASTEDLRQALVHYRFLFSELLDERAAVQSGFRHAS